jgi:hypothetical protein
MLYFHISNIVAAMADFEIIAIGISTIFSFEKSKEWN